MAEDAREVYEAADLALRVGEVVLASGAGAADVYATVLAVTRACGLRQVHVDITFNTLTVSHQPGLDGPPQTYVRTVNYRGLDYGSLTEVDTLVDALLHSTIDRKSARRRIAEIGSAAKPYPRWLVSVASGLVAAGVGALLKGDLVEILVAFVTAVLIDQALRQLARRRIPGFYQQIAGALLATTVALGLHRLDVPVRPSIIIAASIVVLLAGVTLVGAVQDALTGYYVTASARTFEAVLLTGGVIAGVSLGLTIGLRLGVELGVTTRTVFAVDDLLVSLSGGTLVSVAFALNCYAPLRAIAPTAAVGLSAHAVFVPVVAADLGAGLAAAVAAVAVGILSYSLAGRFQVPPLVLVVSGIVGLLPGLTIYRGLFQLITVRDVEGFFLMLTAASIAVGLAAGVLLGEYIAQPLKREARRLETRLAGPRLVGPLHLPSHRERRARKRQLAAERQRGQAEQSRP